MPRIKNNELGIRILKIGLGFLVLYSLFIIPYSTPLSAHGGEHGELIIRMTDEGFEPKELTITEGDEVLFINNDDTDRWPASNFHPTHTIYSDFDPERGIPPGESWKFIFTKPGTWRMHDHLIPHMTGTIVVLENVEASATTTGSETLEKPSFWAKIKAFFSKLFNFSKSTNGVSDKLLAEFKNLDERAKYTWLEETAARENPETAWEYVLAAYKTPEGVTGNPHDMAHLVGQLLYKAYGFEGLATCDPVFAFGCYHGLMEVAFDKDKPEEYRARLSTAQEGCRQIGDENDPSYWSCIHGMGHGVVTFREHDLGKSLTDCDLLGESVRTYCHDGVFMELSISAPPSFYKDGDPIYPCMSIQESYRTSCARSQVQIMKQRFQMDTNEIAQTCAQTGDEKIIYHCVDALGYGVAQASGGMSSQIIAGCQEIEGDTFLAQCMAAAAGELVFQDYVGWREMSKEVCTALPLEYQESCYGRVEQVKQSYGRK